MLGLIIALVVVCLLYYFSKQVPKTEKKASDIDFKALNEKNIMDFGKNKLAKDIEDFGKKLVNGDISVDDYGNIYTDDIYDNAK